jgi:hypothetical protein
VALVGVLHDFRRSALAINTGKAEFGTSQLPQTLCRKASIDEESHVLPFESQWQYQGEKISGPANTNKAGFSRNLVVSSYWSVPISFCIACIKVYPHGWQGAEQVEAAADFVIQE